MTKQTRWLIDHAHSEIGFKVRHLMIAHVKGTFKIFDASIYTVGKDFTTAEIDLWIDASTISTGDEKRDEHLKSADFFDVQKNKQISFRSNTMGGSVLDGNHELWGTLTMNGITKNFPLNVQFGGMITDPWGKERAGFTVTGKINRGDWGLKWNTETETGFMVSEEVIITCEFQVVSADEKDQTIELEPTTSQTVSL